MTDLLFIYGTLLLDESNEFAQFLKNHSSQVGNASYQGKLFEISWYPGVTPSENSEDVVKGQVVKITASIEETLARLDDYEGYLPDNFYASEFVRKKVNVFIEGKLTNCWIYLYNQPIGDLHRITSGDFLSYIATSN